MRERTKRQRELDAQKRALEKKKEEVRERDAALSARATALIQKSETYTNTNGQFQKKLRKTEESQAAALKSMWDSDNKLQDGIGKVNRAMSMPNLTANEGEVNAYIAQKEREMQRSRSASTPNAPTKVMPQRRPSTPAKKPPLQRAQSQRNLSEPSEREKRKEYESLKLLIKPPPTPTHEVGSKNKRPRRG